MAEAWSAFECATTLSSHITPSIPILFFGNLNAYQQSEIRVLTAGLNPSFHEFPEESPFQRFPLAKGVLENEPDRYLNALSAYFGTDPYHSWFSAFEQMLNGLRTSYYEGRSSAALHTDICSPVATNPTWRGLDKKIRRTLEADGVPLWHTLLNALQPQIVVLSVAKEHESRVKFKALSERKDVHVFKRTKAGKRRKQPVKVSVQWYEVGSDPSLLVFVPAAQTPLGKLSNPQKEQVGRIALEVSQNGR